MTSASLPGVRRRKWHNNKQLQLLYTCIHCITCKDPLLIVYTKPHRNNHSERWHVSKRFCEYACFIKCICHHYHSHHRHLHHHFVLLTWMIICYTVSEHHFCPLFLSSETDRGQLSGCVCLYSTLYYYHLLLQLQALLHTGSPSGGARATSAAPPALVCGILNSLCARAAGQREAFCTSEVP